MNSSEVSTIENGVKLPDASDRDAFIAYFKQLGLTSTHISGVFLAQKFVDTKSELELDELKFQELINSINVKIKDDDAREIRTYSIGEIEKDLKEVAKIFDQADEKRKKFSLDLVRDKLVTPIDKIQKRFNPETNEEYVKANARLKELKIEEKRIDALGQAKNKEITDYINHIKNENVKRVAAYKLEYITRINNLYVRLLKEKRENPPIEKIKRLVKDQVKLKPAVKFPRVLITDKEASEIILKQVIPDEEVLLNEAYDYTENKFLLYDNDLALSKVNPNLLVEIEKEKEVEAHQIKTESEQVVATNNLVSNAVSSPTVKKDYKPIKVKVEVEREETWEWMVHVMTCFLQVKDAPDRVNTKTFEAFGIKGMLKALEGYANEQGVKFPQLKYKEVEK